MAASSSDNTPSCQLNSRHSQQLNRISPARVSYPSPNPHISHSAEENELRPEMTREYLFKSNGVDEKLEYAKILLGFAFSMLVSLVVSPSEITKTTVGRIAAIALSFALAFVGSCLPLRKTYPTFSIVCLIFGAILTILSVFALVVSSLPLYLQIILVFCAVLIPLIALALFFWDFSRRENKIKGDTEEGEFIASDCMLPDAARSDCKENNTGKTYERPHHPLFHEAKEKLMEQMWKRLEKDAGRITNEFLASGMFSLEKKLVATDETELMNMKETVMNIIPKSGALCPHSGHQSIGRRLNSPAVE